jgi:hypothetical protein
MGQPPKNQVTLESMGTGHGEDFVRINPDGTPEDEDFRPPAGKVLVVTDVDWQYNSGPPDSRQTFRIRINEDRTSFESTVMLNHQGDGGTSEAMTSGFVVASGSKLVVDVYPGGGVLNHVMVRGYLCRVS